MWERRLVNIDYCTSSKPYHETYGHVTGHVTCGKWWQFKAGGLLGSTNNGYKILANMRSRQHNRQLTRKSAHINDSLFFIRMLYKDAYWRFICIFFVVISAVACYFFAFCQRLIYEYMDMDGYGWLNVTFILGNRTYASCHRTFYKLNVGVERLMDIVWLLCLAAAGARDTTRKDTGRSSQREETGAEAGERVFTVDFVYVKQLSRVGCLSVKRTYSTPDSCLTHLFHGCGRTVV